MIRVVDNGDMTARVEAGEDVIEVDGEMEVADLVRWLLEHGAGDGMPDIAMQVTDIVTPKRDS